MSRAINKINVDQINNLRVKFCTRSVLKTAYNLLCRRLIRAFFRWGFYSTFPNPLGSIPTFTKMWRINASANSNPKIFFNGALKIIFIKSQTYRYIFC